MKILIEAIGTDVAGGPRSVVMGLLRALFTLDRANSYELMVSRREALLANFPNVHQVAVGAHQRFLVRVQLQFWLPRWLAAHGIDLVHFTKNLGAFGLPCPQVLTIHDLTILRYPRLFPMTDNIYWRTVEPLAARAAQVVATVSEDTRRDVIAYYKVPPERVRTVYNAYAPIFRPAAAKDIAGVRDRYGLPPRYILHVGSISPKKNLHTLLLACAQLWREPALPHKLVLVGREYRPGAGAPLREQVRESGLGERVLFTGTVPDADLPAIYSGADVLVLPSMHEGFGVVLLEAMACGTPVVAAGSGAIPEVVGSACRLLRDATDPGELAAAISEAIQDPAQRARYIESGFQRACEFSWEKAASSYLAIYNSIVSGG